MRYLGEKNLISFKSISPDGKLFDMDEFKKAFLNRISIEGHKILNYGYAKGYKPLMEYLFNYMKTKGVDIKGKDIIITNGFTEGLEMIFTAYTNTGDKIICENPTHNTAIKIMKVHGLDVVGVSMTEDGIDVDELEKKLKNNYIKFGYLIPSYHNPTGIVMKGEKDIKFIICLKNIMFLLLKMGLMKNYYITVFMYHLWRLLTMVAVELFI